MPLRICSMNINWQKNNNNYQLKNNLVALWLIEPSGVVSDNSSLLAADEIERAQRYKFLKDQQRFILARTSLRIILSRYLNCSPQEIIFTQNDYGKLSLPHEPSVQFNLSHSEDCVLIAVNLNDQIGVDVEYQTPKHDIAGIVKRFFSAREVQQYQALPEAKQLAAFYHAWTCKEAMIKAVGDGISQTYLSSFEIDLAAQIIELVETPYRARERRPCRASLQISNEWQVYAFNPMPNYQAAVAWQGGEKELEFNQFFVET